MSLTTHVLDTAKGCGAAGMVVEVYQNGALLTAMTLDDGGRAALLTNTAAGSYQILFHAGDYMNDKHFYDVIPVRFNISNPAAHYHIPLILAPYGYSTYRGG
jgi:5-hydroxyisourate hydrolase